MDKTLESSIHTKRTTTKQCSLLSKIDTNGKTNKATVYLLRPVLNLLLSIQSARMTAPLTIEKARHR